MNKYVQNRKKKLLFANFFPFIVCSIMINEFWNLNSNTWIREGALLYKT